MPVTKASTSVSATSSLVRRRAKASIDSSARSGRGRRKRSVSRASFPRQLSTPLLRNEKRPVGSLRSRPFRKRKRLRRALSLAGTRRSARPRSRQSVSVDGLLSRKPFGPVSTRKPSRSLVPTVPPTRSRRARTITPRDGESCARRYASASPEMPPPTITTLLMPSPGTGTSGQPSQGRAGFAGDKRGRISLRQFLQHPPRLRAADVFEHLDRAHVAYLVSRERCPCGRPVQQPLDTLAGLRRELSFQRLAKCGLGGADKPLQLAHRLLSHREPIGVEVRDQPLDGRAHFRGDWTKCRRKENDRLLRRCLENTDSPMGALRVLRRQVSPEFPPP